MEGLQGFGGWFFAGLCALFSIMVTLSTQCSEFSMAQ